MLALRRFRTVVGHLSGVPPGPVMLPSLRLRQTVFPHPARGFRGHSMATNPVAASADPAAFRGKVVTIGDVSVEVPPKTPPFRADLIPVGFAGPEHDSQEGLHNLRWLMQKYLLQQDVFLLGPPGPARRRLAMRFAELLEIETEYLAITRDTTESDLKQRREIVNGNVVYVDQSPVRAAIHGRLLIVEGIEKAERNVLPTLNNLLENREMALEDGRFLVNTDRYDSLLSDLKKQHLDDRKLVRVHSDFRVIALGLPVPRFPGYPLDPPLRSRFQARHIGPLSLNSSIDVLAGLYGADVQAIKSLASVKEALLVVDKHATKFAPKMPILADMALQQAGRMLELFGREHVLNSELLERVFPFTLICDLPQSRTVLEALKRFGVPLSAAHRRLLEHLDAQQRAKQDKKTPGLPNSRRVYSQHSDEMESKSKKKSAKRTGAVMRGQVFNLVSSLCETSREAVGSWAVTSISTGSSGGQMGKHPLSVGFTEVTTQRKCTVPCAGGPLPLRQELPGFVPTEFHAAIFASMVQDHAADRDICLVGGRGCGKSALVRYFASQLGYPITLVQLFKDMTSRDLLQRRSTDEHGDTVWQSAPLVKAALDGGLVVLDGLDRLPPSTLSALRTLIEDRELTLFDGSRLVRWDRYKKFQERFDAKQLAEQRIYPIPPSFRIIALALPPSGGIENWLTEETASLFSFELVPTLSKDILHTLLHNAVPTVAKHDMNTLLNFAHALEDETSGDQSLSLRQLLRLTRHYGKYPADLLDHLSASLLLRHLPAGRRQIVESVVRKQLRPLLGAKGGTATGSSSGTGIVEGKGYLTINGIRHPINKPKNPELVPHIYFVDIANHVDVLANMLKDFSVGERNLLLIGNQGVGKNKLADRLLELLCIEREYMQLHRDTTVQALTVTPSLENGVIVYEDSALVRAVKFGRTLVIDEADKAPVEVVAVLKGLVEDGEMALADGRLIVSPSRMSQATLEGYKKRYGDQLVLVHDSFRLIVLANRPGYPFLGNDFFRECGDVLSCHVVDNPDRASEFHLLRAYGPDVSKELIDKLLDAFGTLRQQVEEGVFAYPYSTRELVNIVKHLQKYPQDGLLQALTNVLAFDVYDSQLLDNLHATFHQHGIPLALSSYSSAPGGLSHNAPVVDIATPLPLAPPLQTSQWRGASSVSQNKTSASVPRSFSTSTLTPTRRLSNVVFCPARSLHAGAHHPVGQAATAASAPHHAAAHSEWDEQVFRSWLVDLGSLHTADSWTAGRFDRFTEEKMWWKVPLTRRGRAVTLTTTPDDTVHVLATHPMSVVSFPAAHSYRRYSVLHLDDFLPLHEIDTSHVNFFALSALNMLVLHVPSHHIAIFVSFPAAASNKQGTATQGGVVEACVSVLPLAPPEAKSSLVENAQRYLKYITPGFKVPSSLMGFGVHTDSFGESVHMDTSFEEHGLLLLSRLGARHVTAIHIAKATGDTVADAMGPGFSASTCSIALPGPLVAMAKSPSRAVVAVSPCEWLLSVKDKQASDTSPSAVTSSVSHYKLKWEATGGRPRFTLSHTQPTGPESDSATWAKGFPGVTGKYPSPGGAVLLGGATTGVGKLQGQKPPLFGLSSLEQPQSTTGVHPMFISSVPRSLDKAAGNTKPSVSVRSSRARPPPPTQVLFNPNVSDLVKSGPPQLALHSSLPAKASSNNIGRRSAVSVIDLQQHSIRYIALPGQEQFDDDGNTDNVEAVAMSRMYGSGDLAVLQADATVRVLQVDPEALNQSVERWRRLFGSLEQNNGSLRLEIASDKQKEAKGPKHGKTDPKNAPHHGGNTWAGGTGGSDTAGLGGKGGPYRLDAGHDVHQMSDEEKAKVSDEVKKAARELAKAELANRLEEINLSDAENSAYASFLGRVAKEVSQLRLILESAEAKNREREWLRHQTQGDLDDGKIVDGVTGDKQIYRRRGVAPQQLGVPQRLPKRLLFLLDVSGSMYRFNGYDHRLDRVMETALLIMESFQGFEHKFKYCLLGHSGDGPAVPLVDYHHPPANRKERLRVLMRMHAHSQYCMSGDHTVESVVHGMKQIVEEEADDYLLFLVSDANMRRYGIAPEVLQDALMADERVSSYAVFIASFEDEASRLIRALPANHAFQCPDVNVMPHIFRTIFQSTLV